MTTGKTLLEATAVIAGYRPDLPILHGVDAQVSAGEVVTIIGPNGAGKSTLIKAIAGLVTITSGKVVIDGRETTGMEAHLLAGAGVAYVPQTGNVFTSLTIQENLTVGGVTLSKAHAARETERIFGLYPMLADRRREKAGVLSGGQRQMLAIARALLTEPRLILLDEPTAGLSPRAAGELFDLVRSLVSDQVAVLMVEQNARAALRMSDRAYVLADGHNRIEGTAQQLLDDPEVGEIFLGQRKQDAPEPTQEATP
ncbi:MAG: ABC transporter ATP-binding protein [Pseudomonadota bacterium]